MGPSKTMIPVPQLAMPGMPEAVRLHPIPRSGGVAPGKQVLYLGNLNGGPRYGSRGVVKRALQRKAIVDMGRRGTWHIPYYFLALPHVA